MACEVHRIVDCGTAWESSPIVAFGPHELNARSRTLSRGDASLRLQAKPLDLLLYLIAHRERVVPHSELLDALWPGIHVTPAALGRAVYKLRRTLGDTREPRSVIATVHGRGFRFVAELRPAGALARLESLPGDSAAREVELARLALERAVRALGDLRAVDAATLSFLRSLIRELCGLFASILGRGQPVEWAGRQAESRWSRSRASQPV